MNNVKLFFDIDGLVDFTRLSATTRMLGDGVNSVSILQGRRSGGTGRIPPSEVQLDYLDDDALLNDENGESPYYRRLVEYTPMIITLNGGTRIYAELASIKVKSVEQGHVKLEIFGAGIKRRLGQGVWAKPLRSPAYRALSSPLNDTTRVFYAPLEEASGATQLEIFGSTGTGTFSGAITFGAYTAAPSAERMLTFGTVGQLQFTLPSYSSTQHKVCSLWTTPATSLPVGTSLLRMYCTGGSIDYIDLEYRSINDGELKLIAFKNGAVVTTANYVNWASVIVNKHFFMSLEFTQNGANVDTRVLIVSATVSSFTDGPLVGVTLGRFTDVIVAPDDCNGASFGSLIVGNATTAFPNYISNVGVSGVEVLGTRGFTNEPADDRMLRLCDEENVVFQRQSSSQFAGGDGTRLGPQPIKPFLEILEQAAEVDGGMLFEALDVPALRYLTRRSLYNQAPKAVATYGQLVPPLLPTKDDQGKQNDVTVGNTNGSRSRYVIPDDDYLHYSTQTPPDGMNSVPGGIDLNLGDDNDTELQAAWRAHRGSWRGTRIPAITIQASRPEVSGDAALMDALTFIDPGHTILQGTLGATKWVPPGNMIGLIEGYSERIAQTNREFSMVTTPGDMWEVKVPDSNASILANNISDTETDLSIDPGLLGPGWTENDVFYAQIDGDVFKVTLLFNETPTHIADGAIANGNNASVVPPLPAGITPDIGQSLFIWATIRNSGTGTPNDIAGWNTITPFGNCKLYHRYYQTGDVAPTVTFSGGVANADTQARMFAFSGITRSLCSGTKLSLGAQGLLNGSAQNVNYPGMTLARPGSAFIFAWKQDDATGYAPPAGFTEMADNSTTTGDDSSIAAYYQLTGTTPLAAGSLVVTGGAAAISRAISLAFRPMQTLIVTRNVQGNAAAHSVGAEVHVWRQGVTGL